MTAVGKDITGVGVGDAVLGAVDYTDYPSAGASDQAILNHWTPRPDALDPVPAAALPMAVETAYRSLDDLGLAAGKTIVIHGAGSTVGFAAVQIVILEGARVIATAGRTFAAELRGFGAAVTAYGDGMVDRVRDLAQGAPDLVLDTSPVGGSLPDLVKIAGGDAQRVLTVSDFDAAEQIGARTSVGIGAKLRYDVLERFAGLAAEGRFTVPVARTDALNAWRDAPAASLSGKAHGKLVLVPGADRSHR